MAFDIKSLCFAEIDQFLGIYTQFPGQLVDADFFL